MELETVCALTDSHRRQMKHGQCRDVKGEEQQCRESQKKEPKGKKTPQIKTECGGRGSPGDMQGMECSREHQTGAISIEGVRSTFLNYPGLHFTSRFKFLTFTSS